MSLDMFRLDRVENFDVENSVVESYADSSYFDFPNRDDVQKKFLVDYFVRLIEEPNFQERINIFIGTTGCGKTYHIFRTFLRLMIDKFGIKCFVYEAPMLELLDRKEIRDIMKECFSDINWKIISTSNLKNYRRSEFNEDIEDHDVTIVLATDAWFNNTTRQKYITDLGPKAMVWRDEIHHGSSSNADLTVDNTGSRSVDMKAKLFRFLESGVKNGCYVFGSTATPTHEIKQSPHIVERGTKLYRIVNEWIDPLQLGGAMKFMNNPEPVVIDGPSDPNLDKVIHNFIWSIHNKPQRAMNIIKSQLGLYKGLFDGHVRKVLKAMKFKTTGLCLVENTFEGKETISKEVVLEKFAQAYKPEDFEWALTTADGWEIYAGDSNVPIRVGEKGDNLGWINELNSDKSNVKAVIAVMKGNMGINIMNLCDGLFLRSSDSLKDSTGKEVLNRALQTIGRFNRPWRGGLSNRDVGVLPKELQFEIYQLLNTFDITHVDTGSWELAFNEYVDRYGVTFQVAVDEYAR